MEVVWFAPPPPPPPPIIFEGTKLTQTNHISLEKEYLMASRIHFKYWKNFLISRLMSNFCEMTPQRPCIGSRIKFELLKYEHIIEGFEARDPEIPNM